jgi:hypothetical protein
MNMLCTFFLSHRGFVPLDFPGKVFNEASVLKIEPIIEPVKVSSYWFIGRTTESLVEPHD